MQCEFSCSNCTTCTAVSARPQRSLLMGKQRDAPPPKRQNLGEGNPLQELHRVKKGGTAIKSTTRDAPAQYDPHASSLRLSAACACRSERARGRASALTRTRLLWRVWRRAKRKSLPSAAKSITRPKAPKDEPTPIDTSLAGLERCVQHIPLSRHCPFILLTADWCNVRAVRLQLAQNQLLQDSQTGLQQQTRNHLQYGHTPAARCLGVGANTLGVRVKG
jgi:hypothetical protein